MSQVGPAPVTVGEVTVGLAAGGNAADVAVRFALSQVGKPYVWGATGPNGYDCSGLVQASYQAAGISLPRTTYQQVTVGTPVAKADLQVGDLVFPDAGHVQLYIGNGNVVEAQHTGTNILVDPMWGFWAARRVTQPGTGTYGKDSAGNPVSSSTSFNPLTGLNPLSIFSQNNAVRLLEIVAGLAFLFFALSRLEPVRGGVKTVAKVGAIAAI